ncbi:MAG: hypothetical protein IPJ69_04775 [Deltaproteobacteria bacterium]|nr:MAG: hypothetical protein IPJ69_04775 [Deltaproteobacteria bacterium]
MDGIEELWHNSLTDLGQLPPPLPIAKVVTPTTKPFQYALRKLPLIPAVPQAALDSDPSKKKDSIS